MQRSNVRGGGLCLWILLLVLWVLIGTGCVPNRGASKGEVRPLTDTTGETVYVPIHPARVISVGVSTDDILIPLLGHERIAAIADLPSNFPSEASQIQGRISMATESIMAYQPDLVVIPDWASPDFVQELRSLALPVYVYHTPTTWEGAIARIYELSNVVNEAEKGNRLAEAGIARMHRLETFLDTIPQAGRRVAAYDTTLGFTGGAGSSFDELCHGAGLRNGLAEAGLSKESTAGREMVLSVNPDIIFIASDIYDKGQYKALKDHDIYTDPALSRVTAVQNREVYTIDARWLMSTSQFMVRAMEDMAAAAYGYQPEPWSESL